MIPATFGVGLRTIEFSVADNQMRRILLIRILDLDYMSLNTDIWYSRPLYAWAYFVGTPSK